MNKGQPGNNAAIRSRAVTLAQTMLRNPSHCEKLVIGNRCFKVLHADKRRIHILQLALLPETVESRDSLDEHEA